MLGSEQVGTPYFNSVNAAGSAGARAWLRSSAAEVWAKFFLALVGLGLAFGAALFSDSLGRGRTSLGFGNPRLRGSIDGGFCRIDYSAVPGATGGARATAADISL